MNILGVGLEYGCEPLIGYVFLLLVSNFLEDWISLWAYLGVVEFNIQVGLASPYVFFGNDVLFARVENMQDFGVTCIDVFLVHDVAWLTLGIRWVHEC